jgi:hypothetical protein
VTASGKHINVHPLVHQRQSRSRLCQENNTAPSLLCQRPPAFTELSHHSSSFTSCTAISSTRQPLRLTSPGQRREDQSAPSRYPLKPACCGQSLPASIRHTLCYQYGPFQGHQISSITAYAACLPTHLYI